VTGDDFLANAGLMRASKFFMFVSFTTSKNMIPGFGWPEIAHACENLNKKGRPPGPAGVQSSTGSILMCTFWNGFFPPTVPRSRSHSAYDDSYGVMVDGFESAQSQPGLCSTSGGFTGRTWRSGLRLAAAAPKGKCGGMRRSASPAFHPSIPMFELR
jgi:hypothetical protein